MSNIKKPGEIRTFWFPFFKNLTEDDFLKIFKVLSLISVNGYFKYNKATLEKLKNDPDGKWFLKTVQLDEDNPMGFAPRCASFIRNLANFLKNNPSYTTDKMVEFAEKNPPLNTIVRRFVVKNLPQSQIPTIQPDNQVLVEGKHTQSVQVSSDEEKYMNAVGRLVDFFDKASKTILVKDYKQLSIESKIKVLKDIASILALKPPKGFKWGGTNVFNKINVYNSNLKDLETAVVDWLKQNQEQ